VTTIILDNPKLEQDIPIERIHPDPFQPRLEPDADLADSIKSQGILQAIRVEVIDAGNSVERICPDCGKLFVDLQAEGGHFMLQDGERRLRGSIRAGSKTILAKVVAPVAQGKRLIQQLTANSGLPLSPIEEAFAFQRLVETEGWSQNELARQLGRPRSVVGDRIRLVALDPVWLDMIQRGKLQPSHGPELHRYVEVPAKYQAEAAKKIAADIDDDPAGFSIDDFDWRLRDAFRDFVTPLSEASPQYKGPVIELAEYGSRRKFAADPEQWKPIVAEKAKRAKQEKKSATTRRGSPQREKSALDQLPDLPRRKAGGLYDITLLKGEIKVWSEQQGWDNSFLGLPAVFLSKVDQSKLTGVDLKYSGAVLLTSDAEAVAEARAAYTAVLQTHVEAHSIEVVASVKTQAPRFRIAGPGARAILESAASSYGNPVPMLARALGLKVEGLSEDQRLSRRGELRISDADADLLATAYIATVAGAVKVTTEREISSKLWQKYSRLPFKLPTSKKEKQVPIARGKDVDVGAMRAAVEAGAIDSIVETEEHAELVEA
jgi:ParB/RepB/Spo0J family partition protein